MRPWTSPLPATIGKRIHHSHTYTSHTYAINNLTYTSHAYAINNLTYTSHSYVPSFRCVTFKDDEGVTVNLVDRCIVCTWLYYICHMRGHPMPDSNACQLVLKYLLMNRASFIKAYHDRSYYYSSGTKFEEVSFKLDDWMKRQSRRRAAYQEEPDDVCIQHTHASNTHSRIHHTHTSNAHSRIDPAHTSNIHTQRVFCHLNRNKP